MMSCTRLTVRRSCRGRCIRIRSTSSLRLRQNFTHADVASETRLSFPKNWQLRACVSRRSSSVGRRRRFVVSRGQPTFTRSCYSFSSATRNRASGAARDQREETGAAGKRGIASVCAHSSHDRRRANITVSPQQPREPIGRPRVTVRVPSVNCCTMMMPGRKQDRVPVYPSCQDCLIVSTLSCQAYTCSILGLAFG